MWGRLRGCRTKPAFAQAGCCLHLGATRLPVPQPASSGALVSGLSTLPFPGRGLPPPAKSWGPVSGPRSLHCPAPSRASTRGPVQDLQTSHPPTTLALPTAHPQQGCIQNSKAWPRVSDASPGW